MRSEKLRPELASGIPKVYGRMASEYIQATAPILGLQKGQLTTVPRNKGLAVSHSKYADLSKNGPKQTQNHYLRDLTNLEHPTAPYPKQKDYTHEVCQRSKCQKNVELLEKSIEMIEQLKVYVSKASEKPSNEQKNLFPITKADFGSPNRPDIAQTLELLWTSNQKLIPREVDSEPKFQHHHHIGTQTEPFCTQVSTPQAKKLTADQSCSVHFENSLKEFQIIELKKSLQDSMLSNSELERRLADLKEEV
jgi:hypothetical protein